MDDPSRSPGLPVAADGPESAGAFVEMLLKAVDEGLDPVFAMLPSGRLCYVNQAICRKLGYRREELLAMDLKDIDPDASPERWASNWARVKAEGAAVLESVHRGKDGAAHPVEVTGTYLNHQGREMLFGNIRDLTGRKSAEQALATSENRFRDLLERQGEGFAATDESEVFIYANPVAETIFGVPPGGLAGRSLLDFLGEAEAALVAHQTGLRKAGGRSTYDIQIRRPSGEPRTIQVTATPRAAPDGGYGGTIGVFRDITDTRAMEEALRQTQKLESLGLLAGGIAHDFNNLLTAVMGNLNLAQSLVPEGAPAAPFLEKVERTVLRAADLTRQMLAYSGRGQFQVAPLDLNQVVRDIVHLMKVSIPKTASLRFHLSKGLPPIEADAAQIQQVIMNLVVNAAEALEDREGMIIVGTRVLELETAAPPLFLPAKDLQPGRHVVLDVSDTGCGMGPEVQARIFDPFFTTKPSGRGLGLSAMLGILRGHGAGIRIRSSPGRGSTFELFFPACAGELPPPAPWDPAPETAMSGCVLLVDDEEVLREATGAALEAMGFEVLTAVDGAQALERFEAEAGRIRLVLMDLTMPRMDGRRAFRAMHASHPEIPVLLSSGYDRNLSTEGVLDSGLAGFLQKPYRIPELRRAVALALEQAGTGKDVGKNRQSI